MINDETNSYYYCALKNLSEVNSLGWLINNNYNNNTNYQIIESNPQRISKLKPYINKYNWEGINFPAGSNEWRKFEQNNDTIALNILYTEKNSKNKYCISIKI